MLKKLLCLYVFILLTCLLCACDKSNGKLYSIDEAYEFGWLNQVDIMEICYFRFGEIWMGEEYNSETWIKSDYVPNNSLTKIDQKVELEIKETYYNANKNKFVDKEGHIIGGINDLNIRFFGEYNGCYVVQIQCSLWDTGATVTPKLLAGVAWWEFEDGLVIYKIN